MAGVFAFVLVAGLSALCGYWIGNHRAYWRGRRDGYRASQREPNSGVDD